MQRMQWTDKAECPRCKKHYVFSEHKIGINEKWRIFCMYCGRKTIWCKTHLQAEKEWEHIKDAENNS